MAALEVHTTEAEQNPEDVSALRFAHIIIVHFFVANSDMAALGRLDAVVEQPPNFQRYVRVNVVVNLPILWDNRVKTSASIFTML